MIKGLTLVQVRALRAFTKTTKHGQFHGDPNGIGRAIMPFVPDYVVDELVASRNIELIDAPEGKAPSPASPKLMDRDDDYVVETIGIGRYRISGPGIDEPKVIKGKADMETFIAGVKTALAEGGAADTDAPAE